MQVGLVARVAVVVALVLTPPVLRAAPDPQLADPRVLGLLEQADKLSLALRLDEAQGKVDEAIALAEKTGDRIGLARSYNTMGHVLLRLGLPAAGKTWYDRGLAAFEALGDKPGIAASLGGLTATSVATGESAIATAYGNRALQLFAELGNDRGRALVLQNFMLMNSPPEVDAARLRELTEIATRLNDNALLALALRMEGTSRFSDGDLAGARVSIEAAIARYEKGADIESLAASYVNLGRIFRAHGDYDGAIARYRKAIDLLAPTKERRTMVEATNALAIALGHLNRHQDAIAAYERGLTLARESGQQRIIDFMEGNLAGGLMAAGEYARAIPALETVIAKKPDPYILSYRRNSLAMALTHVGREADALPHENEAVRIARELNMVSELGSFLDGRAWILSRLGRFEDALADARECLAITEQMRAKLVPSDFMKRGYAERNKQAYTRAVDLLSRLGREADALEFAEQGRGRAFLDLLAARDTESIVPATRGEALKPGAGDLASESIGRPLAIAGIRSQARRLGSTILTYWLTADSTLVWLIRPDGALTHARLSISPEKVALLVAATTAPLRASPETTTTRGAEAQADSLAALPMRGLGLLALSRDDKAAWRDLYTTLIEPVRADLPARGSRLIIVPHGPLFQLSFAALRNAAGRYLVEDYELSYAPSASVLDFTGRRQEAAAANAASPWAVVGNPVSLPLVGNRPLAPLPGAAREITSVARLAPSTNTSVRLDGSRADEAALARTLEALHPSVLHFATHGFVFDDPKQPPFLALNRRGTSPADDGRLTLDEVYGLRLATDLVVLSACRTGSGKVSSDGIVGLTRGFFYAGTPSVMATFWDVADETTARLMSGFYRGYVRTRAKGASLRAAQLALLADLRAGKVVVTISGRTVTLPEHPLLWAAFFLSGEP